MRILLLDRRAAGGAEKEWSHHVFSTMCLARKVILRQPSDIGVAMLLAFVMLGGSAWGQSDGANLLLEMSLDDLTRIEIPTVIGAAKYEQSALLAPSSVTVVTAEEIKRYGHTTLGDILRSVRGFYITNNRNYSFAGTRGFNRPGDFNSRVLVMMDGHRINDNIYGQGSVGGEFPLDVDLIDRVEIIRGPGSSLYGTGAFFAVVNVIAKKGADIDGAQIVAGGGSNTQGSGRVTLGKKFDNGLDAMASVSAFDTKGQKNIFFPEYANQAAFNRGVSTDADAERWNSIYGHMNFKELTLQFASVVRRKTLPTGIYAATFGDADNFTIDTHQYLDLQYQRDVGTDGNIHLRAYADHYKYDADLIYDVPPRVVNKDSGRAKWWGTELRYTTRLMEKHRVTVGAEYVNNTASDQRNFDVAPFALYNNAPYKYTTSALYAQDEFAATEQLSLTIGLRLDRQYQGIQSTNPRIAAVYVPEPGTAIKLLYGTAFRAANSYERFSETPTLQPNPNLKPEEIKTTEFVVEHSFRANIRGIFSVYRYQLDRLITQVTDPVTALDQYQNTSRINARGFDMELQAKFRPLEGRVSYSQQVTKDTASGLTLSNSPKHLFKLNLIAPIVDMRLSAGWETQYVSSRVNWANRNVPGYAVSNLTLLGRDWVKSLEVSAGIYNVFDKRYAEPTSNDDASALISIPQDRRSFRVRAQYKF